MAEAGVVVIGAGIVGVSAAIAARPRGLPVLLLDREAPTAGASAGNAGAFAVSDILPLASPGMLQGAGLAQSAGTARIVADLLAGTHLPIDTGAFSAHRFSQAHSFS